MTMLRSIVVSLVTAACFSAFTFIEEVPGGSAGRAAASVVLGLIATACIYGDVTWMTVVLGALSPLAYAWLAPSSSWLALAAMCSLWLAPRLVLADTNRRRWSLALVSVAAAGSAAWVVATYATLPLASHAAACVFAGACVSLVGLLVPVQTTTSYALRSAASVIDAPVASSILRAADMHDEAKYLPSSRDTRRRWRKLTTLADRRAALRSAPRAAPGELASSIDAEITAALAMLAPKAATLATENPTETREASAAPESPETRAESPTTERCPSNPGEVAPTSPNDNDMGDTGHAPTWPPVAACAPIDNPHEESSPPEAAGVVANR